MHLFLCFFVTYFVRKKRTYAIDYRNLLTEADSVKKKNFPLRAPVFVPLALRQVFLRIEQSFVPVFLHYLILPPPPPARKKKKNMSVINPDQVGPVGWNFIRSCNLGEAMLGGPQACSPGKIFKIRRILTHFFKRVFTHFSYL